MKLDELSVLLDEMLAESAGPLTNTEIWSEELVQGRASRPPARTLFGKDPPKE